MLDQFPKKIKLVVKPFASPEQPTDWLAASAALAAHRQGKFWPYREQLFRLGGVVSMDDLRETARQVGIDLPRFLQDLSSPTIQNLLAACVNDGLRRGVFGTPTVFVNQSEVRDLSPDALTHAIESHLPD